MNVSDLRQRLTQLPQVKLIDLPTPLHDCPRLAQAIGVKRFLMKRDDLTGLAFGGNKSRKFEFSFADALAQGCDVVITGAAAQSNHARQAAAAAAKLGLKCYLVNRHDHRSRLGIQGNLLLDYILGAEVRLVDGVDQQRAKEQLAEELKARGHKPYIIGERAAALGAVAYVGCVVEMQEQLTALGLKADVIAFASANGTQSGLALGAKILGLDAAVLGFSPSVGDEAARKRHIAACANQAAEILGIDTRLSPDEIRNTQQYVGERYGVLTPAGLDAIELVARTEGILLDPVYTAKAMSGVIDMVRQGAISKDSTVVFVHTGGNPALFAYQPELVEHGRYAQKVVTDLGGGVA